MTEIVAVDHPPVRLGRASFAGACNPLSDGAGSPSSTWARYLAKGADSGLVLPFSNPCFCSRAIRSVAFGEAAYG